jgi:hypothetical protein
MLIIPACKIRLAQVLGEWQTRVGAGSGFEPVVDLSFKARNQPDAVGHRDRLPEIVGDRGWLLDHDVLKTTMILERYECAFRPGAASRRSRSRQTSVGGPKTDDFGYTMGGPKSDDFGYTVTYEYQRAPDPNSVIR